MKINNDTGMNAKTPNDPAPNALPTRLWRYGVGGVLLACGTMIDHRMAAAPSVIANPVPQAPLQTQDQQTTTNEMQVFAPGGGGGFEEAGQPGGAPLPEMFRWGPVQLHPHVDYRFMYGNGIQATPGNQQKTVIQELSPGIMIDLGTHWALDYTPTFRFYSDKQFQDGVDHAVSLTGGVDYDAWRFGLSHSTAISSAPTVETGGQTDQSSHSTSLTAARALGSRMSTDLSVNQSISLVSGFNNSYDWNTMDWLNYEFWPRFNAGLGGGGGYVLIEGNGNGNGQIAGANTGSSDETYEELQARVNWRATEKLSFQLHGGLEDRQFSTGSDSSLNPIYGASVEWKPFKYTDISLNATRTVSSSEYYVAAQQTVETVVGVNLSQRLFKKFTVGAGASYTKEDFDSGNSNVAGAAVNRTDDVYSFNVSLNHPFYQRGSWSIFYQYSKDTSSQQQFGFASSQVGFEISYRF